MSTKHTPGPWRASELGVLAENLTSYGNWYVCSLIDPDNAEHKANARLIAAAPELLDALTALMEFWDNDSPVHPGAEVVSDARAAIAKATAE